MGTSGIHYLSIASFTMQIAHLRRYEYEMESCYRLYLSIASFTMQIAHLRRYEYEMESCYRLLPGTGEIRLGALLHKRTERWGRTWSETSAFANFGPRSTGELTQTKLRNVSTCMFRDSSPNVPSFVTAREMPRSPHTQTSAKT
jgi:hypothetical protein